MVKKRPMDVHSIFQFRQLTLFFRFCQKSGSSWGVKTRFIRQYEGNSVLFDPLFRNIEGDYLEKRPKWGQK